MSMHLGIIYIHHILTSKSYLKSIALNQLGKNILNPRHYKKNQKYSKS